MTMFKTLVLRCFFGNMIFGYKDKECTSSDFSLKIDGSELNRVFHTKFLGVYINSCLNWKTHTYQLSIKVSKILGVINRVRHVLSCKILRLLYTTLILPYFSY